MAEEREQATSGGLVRWWLFGAAVLTGIGLYLALGRDIEPVAQPVVLEEEL